MRFIPFDERPRRPQCLWAPSEGGCLDAERFDFRTAAASVLRRVPRDDLHPRPPPNPGREARDRRLERLFRTFCRSGRAWLVHRSANGGGGFWGGKRGARGRGAALRALDNTP